MFLSSHWKLCQNSWKGPEEEFAELQYISKLKSAKRVLGSQILMFNLDSDEYDDEYNDYWCW